MDWLINKMQAARSGRCYDVLFSTMGLGPCVFICVAAVSASALLPACAEFLAEIKSRGTWSKAVVLLLLFQSRICSIT